MTTPVVTNRGPRLIASSSPPTLSKSPPPPPTTRQHQPQPPLKTTTTSRRNAVFLSLSPLLPFLSHPTPATAFSIGISGPKDWLRDQKKKASKYLLAPIQASRDTLRTAYLILNGSESTDPNKDLAEIQGLLKSAARDCVTQDRNSFVSFQAKTGVEVCTFQLIVNNAASLLDKNDPVKLEAETMLAHLLRSFTLLGGVTNEADLQLVSSRKKVADALMDTIFSLDKFEQGIMDCLEA